MSHVITIHPDPQAVVHHQSYGAKLCANVSKVLSVVLPTFVGSVMTSHPASASILGVTNEASIFIGATLCSIGAGLSVIFYWS